MIFSHGLGGNRNAYSHIVGSVASHGVVVVCPEHRDGSSVVSFIRDPAGRDKLFRRNVKTTIPYIKIPHTEIPEVWDARNQQLKIRLWELGLIHEAVQKLADGASMMNLNATTPASTIEMFTNKLRVKEPGSIIWAGHSFGSASIHQLVKSVYYADLPEIKAMKTQLFQAAPNSSIRRQITERSPTILLDMWCFPLVSEATRPLYNLPLPAYADVETAPGGAGLLAIQSETFYKWTTHLHTTAKVMSPDPSVPEVSVETFERPSGMRMSEPNLFYVENSAHLNQSDFALLFPWVTKKIFGAEEPERAIRLNLRAILQYLRTNGVPVARTWAGDVVDNVKLSKQDMKTGSDRGVDAGIDDDQAIFDRTPGTVSMWHWIDTVGLGQKAGDHPKVELGGHSEILTQDESKQLMEGEEEMQGELEPHLGKEAGMDAGHDPCADQAAVEPLKA